MATIHKGSAEDEEALRAEAAHHPVVGSGMCSNSRSLHSREQWSYISVGEEGWILILLQQFFYK